MASVSQSTIQLRQETANVRSPVAADTDEEQMPTLSLPRSANTFRSSNQDCEAATIVHQTASYSPHSPLIARKHRPELLRVARSNGFTTTSTSDLKQLIRNGETSDCVTITQIPRPRLRHQSNSPDSMGNKPSSIDDSDQLDKDASSLRSVVRKPVRVPRKTSTNHLKRTDAIAKSPFPPEMTTSTVIQVQQNQSQSIFDKETSRGKNFGSIDPFGDESQVSNPLSLSPVHMHSASAGTDPNANTSPSLSASNTIRDLRSENPDPFTFCRNEPRTNLANEHSTMLSPLSHKPTLSPTIPAPTTLPEDTPHKYGLRDRMDTPEIPEPEINVPKARRRSSGVDIFNEAKSLQSASSFLNGLSTSRRRAESAQRTTETSAWTSISHDTRPSTPIYVSDRRRGHNFKPSGFAYTRPLGIVQLKCYANHARLFPSPNRTVPVECAVCHIDDDQDHYSCTWCALRMCGYCRKEFSERGPAALRERIKLAEMGGMEESTYGDFRERGMKALA